MGSTALHALLAGAVRVVSAVVLWVFVPFLAWVFIRQDLARFLGHQRLGAGFSRLAFPVWFRALIGVAETAATLLLLTRRTAFAGAIIIIVVMIGAMGTHVDRGHPARVPERRSAEHQVPGTLQRHHPRGQRTMG